MRKTISESDLTMPRRKPRSLALSLSYRLLRLGRALFGAKRTLRFFLNAAWLAWRFAFELSSDVFGSSFQTEARGTSEELLGDVVAPGAVVLDAGCGPGRWSRLAARRAGKVIGVDASAAAIAEARRATSEPNLEYVAGDVRDAIAGRHFDVELLIHVIEHVDDVDAFLRLMAAAADVLIVEIPNFEADPLDAVRQELDCRFYSDADHVREYTPEILSAQLLRNGLEIVREEQNRGSIVAVARQPRSL